MMPVRNAKAAAMNQMIEQMIDRGDGIRLATRFQPGRGPTLMFLPGYMSDMSGTKAQHLLRWAAETGRQCLLLDYSGCGASEGAFEAGSIRRWAARDALGQALMAATEELSAPDEKIVKSYMPYIR